MSTKSVRSRRRRSREHRRAAHRRARWLKRPPILSYDGYALYNWKRFREDGPIRLGNIDTIQNFVHMYDEHWFILVHVEIESIAADILGAIATVKRKQIEEKDEDLRAELWRIENCVRRQVRCQTHSRAHGFPAVLQDLSTLHPLL